MIRCRELPSFEPLEIDEPDGTRARLHTHERGWAGVGAQIFAQKQPSARDGFVAGAARLSTYWWACPPRDQRQAVGAIGGGAAAE